MSEAPDTPEVDPLRQRLAIIRRAGGAVCKRIAEMRQQAPEEDRDFLDRRVSLLNELRRSGVDRYGSHETFAPVPPSQACLPSWLVSLLPSWLAEWSSPSSSADAEVPAGVGVELRGPGSGAASAAAGHASTPHVRTRHRHAQQQAAS